jgi:peptidyl-prolyl cis-trans isomerase SurA
MYMNMIKYTVLLCCISISAKAQIKEIGARVLADKIVGVVGDKIVLFSDLNNQILDFKRQGVTIPENAECIILDRALSQKALVVQAQLDSLPVSDDEVQATIENKLREFIQAYGSEEEVVKISGKSLFQIREDFKDPIKERLYAQAMERKIVENVRITPNEVKAYYDKQIKDSLPFYEAMIEVSELVIYPKMSADAEAYLTEKLSNIKTQVESGRKNFATLATIESDDPGTKQNGGEFTINRATDRQFVDPTFFKAAFALREGEVSKVVKSKFGLHIIQMVSRRGDIAVVRHILKTPQFLEEDLIATKAKLDSIKELIGTNKISFGKAVELFSNDDDTKYTAGKKYGRNDNGELTALLPIDKFDKDLIPILKDLKVGQLSSPVQFKSQQDKLGVRIILLERTTDPHRENLKDDYSIISKKALTEKKEEAMQHWFVKNLPRFYTKVAPEYTNCTILKKWKIAD